MNQGARTELRVSSFQGVQNLPLYVAMRQGYFAAHGLAVELTFTTGSAAQLAGLAQGDYHLIQTAPDNVINLDTRPDAFGLDPASAPRAVLVLGGSIGPLNVFGRAGVSSMLDLRESALGVDNPSSGYALVLRDLLNRHGLVLGRDYTFVVAGGTHARCDALLVGSIAATILYSPFDLRAAERGCSRLASSADAYPAYASGSTAGRQSWIDAHGETVTRYIEAHLRAVRWLYDPANADAAQAFLRDIPTLGVAPDLVAQAYAAFIAPTTGFGRDAALDPVGLRQVIALRAQYAAPDVPLGEPESYCDLRWYRAALARHSRDDPLRAAQDNT